MPWLDAKERHEWAHAEKELISYLDVSQDGSIEMDEFLSLSKFIGALHVNYLPKSTLFSLWLVAAHLLAALLAI